MVATVHGEWVDEDGGRTGSYAVYLPVRLTDPDGDLIYPAGLFATGSLVNGEFTVTVPGSDDPDISPQDWQLVIQVSFGAGFERYAIPVPDGTTVELADVVLPQDLGEPEPVLIRGVAGGIAELDEDGLVPLSQLPVGDLGWFLMSDQGVWAADTDYDASDVVTYVGARYVAPEGSDAADYFNTAEWVLLGAAPDTF